MSSLGTLSSPLSKGEIIGNNSFGVYLLNLLGVLIMFLLHSLSFHALDFLCLILSAVAELCVVE